MQQFLKASSHLALAAVLGLAMSACVGLNQANAQGKMKKDKPVKTRTMDDRKMSAPAMTDDDEDLTLPLTPGYPNAAPGSLNLYHWKDYTRKEMEAGSATDVKSDKMMQHDKMMKDRGSMDEEDEDLTLPLTPGYPNAAPGSLHLYHWKDYTEKEMEPGSAMDKKMDKEHMKDKAKMDRDKTMSHTMADDDEDLAVLPLTPGYPVAAPGSLHLYHWKDYTEKEMEPGSAMDKKMEKEQKMDKKKMK